MGSGYDFFMIVLASAEGGFNPGTPQKGSRTDHEQNLPSTADLRGHIERFVERCNAHPRPFAWPATADSIFANLERLVKLSAGRNPR